MFEKMKKLKPISGFIKPISGIVLLIGLFLIIDIKQVQDVLIKTETNKVVFALFFGIFANIISIYRWKLILKLMYGDFTLTWLVCVFGQSLSLNSVLPGGIVGGDVFRSYSVASKLPKGRKKIGPKSVIVDRFCGLWSVVIISMISGLIIFLTISFEENHNLFKYYLLFLFAVTITPFLARTNFSKKILVKFEKNSNLIIFKIKQIIKLAKTASNYLVASFLLSLITTLFAVLNFWFCLQAVQVEIALIQLLFCSTFIFLSSVVPFSFAGFGPRELGSVAILSLYGFAGEALLVASVLYGLTTIFQGIMCLPLFLKPPKDPFMKN
tara:strand:- start:28414 stop:29388 length:975 start_codon:yes stop_codon:yes gene_type:complete